MRRTTTRYLTLVALLLSLGCKDRAPNAPGPAPAPTPVASLTPAQRAGFEPVFAEYEHIRAELAQDQLEKIPSLTTKLVTATSSATAGGPPALSAKLGDLKAKATGLQAAAGRDLAATRLAFGELSRSLVALLENAPELRGSRVIFECGMAEGYQKWIQPGGELENPYMGQSMPSCGSKTDWVP